MHIVVVPTLVFAVFYAFAILDPGSVGWVANADLGQHMLGWQALRYDAWRIPLAESGLIYPPLGLSILFLDGNPLFSLIFKPFSEFLPRHAQFIGIWILFCMVLNYYFGFQLMRVIAFGDEPIPGRRAETCCVLGGALLMLLPALHYRIQHDTLMAHWIFLAAMLFVFRANGRNHLPWLLAVVAVGVLVHPYFLAMTAPFLALGLLLGWLKQEEPFVRPVLIRSVALPVGVVGAAFIVLLGPVLGVITLLPPGLTVSSYGGSPGDWTMDPFAWFNARGDVGIGYSLVLPGWTAGPLQQNESFQYLGLGAIALVVVSLGLLLATRRVPRALRRREIAALGLGAALLYLFALSPVVTAFGSVVFTVPIGEIPVVGDLLMKPWIVFRSSGRMGWPAGFLLVALAAALLIRLAPRSALPALIGLVAVQIVDISPLISHTRAMTSAEREIAFEPGGPTPEGAALWRGVVSGASGVALLPITEGRSFYESDRALSLGLYSEAFAAGVPVVGIYAAQAIGRLGWAQDDEARARAVVRDGRDPAALLIVELGWAEAVLCPGAEGLYRRGGYLYRLPQGAVPPPSLSPWSCAASE